MFVPRRKGPSEEELKQAKNWRQEQKEYLGLLPLDLLAKVPEWKESYMELFAVSINSNWYIFRPATFEEFSLYISQVRSDIFSESRLDAIPEEVNIITTSTGTVHKCIEPNPFLLRSDASLFNKLVLYPTDLKDLSIEEHTILKNCIIDNSGFGNTKIREYMGELQGIMNTNVGLLAVISQVLGITVDDLRKKTAAQIAADAACVEGITGKPIYNKPMTLQQRPDSMGSPSKESKLTEAIKAHKHEAIKDSAPNGIINIDSENLHMQQMGFSEESGSNTALEILQEIKDKMSGK